MKKRVKEVKGMKEDTKMIVKILEGLSQDFGEISCLSNEEQLFIVPTIIPSFNRASQIGGLPAGSIVEFHGPEQGGKTTLGVGILASAQKLGYVIGILDYEGSFKDKKWPISLGLKMDESVLYKRPLSLEEGANWLDKGLMNFKKRQEEDKDFKDLHMIWLVDSITAMVPQEVIEGEVGKRNFGLQANILSSWLPKLNSIINGTKISIIFINQERTNQDRKNPYARKWRRYGGDALGFYDHFRVRILASQSVKIGEEVIGTEHTFYVMKNKLGAKEMLGRFFTSNGKELPLGWDFARIYFDEASEIGLIKKESKKWVCDFDDETKDGIFEGRLIKKLNEEKEFMKWMKKKMNIRENF